MRVYSNYRMGVWAIRLIPYFGHSIHRNLLLSAYKVMAIPQLCVYHYDDKAHVTGWGHSAVTYNPDTCVAEWHMGRYVYDCSSCGHLLLD